MRWIVQVTGISCTIRALTQEKKTSTHIEIARFKLNNGSEDNKKSKEYECQVVWTNSAVFKPKLWEVNTLAYPNIA